MGLPGEAREKSADREKGQTEGTEREVSSSIFLQPYHAKQHKVYNLHGGTI